MIQVTPRQLEVLGFIHDFTGTHQKAPTYLEIGDHFGFTRKAAFDHVRLLEKKECLTTTWYLARSIKITDKGFNELMAVKA